MNTICCLDEYKQKEKFRWSCKKCGQDVSAEFLYRVETANESDNTLQVLYADAHKMLWIAQKRYERNVVGLAKARDYSIDCETTYDKKMARRKIKHADDKNALLIEARAEKDCEDEKLKMRKAGVMIKDIESYLKAGSKRIDSIKKILDTPHAKASA